MCLKTIRLHQLDQIKHLFCLLILETNMKNRKALPLDHQAMSKTFILIQHHVGGKTISFIIYLEMLITPYVL